MSGFRYDNLFCCCLLSGFGMSRALYPTSLYFDHCIISMASKTHATDTGYKSAYNIDYITI